MALIASEREGMKYITVLFPQVLRKRSPSKSVMYIVFKLKRYCLWICGRADGAILNFWRFKAMNIGF